MIQKKDSVGLFKVKQKFFYNSDDKIIERQEYYPWSDNNLKSKLSRKTKKEYSDGLLTHICYLNSKDKIRSSTKIVYDGDNRKTKFIRTYPRSPDGNYSTKYSYYKQTDFPSKMIHKRKNKTITAKFKYTFDEHKNWTKQVKTVNGKKYVLTREITYYE